MPRNVLKSRTENNEVSLGFIFLKLKLYQKANEHFAKALSFICVTGKSLYIDGIITSLSINESFKYTLYEVLSSDNENSNPFE